MSMPKDNLHLSHAADCALVVVDVQERLVSAMPNGVKERVIERVTVLLTAAKTLSVPVLVTEQYPNGLGPTEQELVKQLPDGTPVFEKTCFSATRADGFVPALEQTGRKQIVLVGMETHICVLQTALALQAQGYQVFVVEDAVSSRSKANQYNALQRMRSAGVIVSNVESVIFEWLEDSAQENFKTLAQLII
jgi:nicotinamidase-related amidase